MNWLIGLPQKVSASSSQNHYRKKQVNRTVRWILIPTETIIPPLTLCVFDLISEGIFTNPVACKPVGNANTAHHNQYFMF